jgi:hypothetical protein
MNIHILNIILIIHILIVIFVTVIPFSNNNYFLFLHTIIVPLIIFHWIVNKNTCILSTIEKQLRQSIHNDYSEDNCFTCKIISPIYEFKFNYAQHSLLIYIITIVLWIISATKLYRKIKSGEISKFSDVAYYSQ